MTTFINDLAGTWASLDHLLRIDLVLVSDALKAQAKASGIERDPRNRERPCDHAPVWVEIG